MHEVLFETNSKTLVKVIKSHATPENELGDLIIQCKSFLKSNPDFVVTFIRRQTNTVAHSIARASLSHSNFHIFYHIKTTMYSIIWMELTNLAFAKKIYNEIKSKLHFSPLEF